MVPWTKVLLRLSFSLASIHAHVRRSWKRSTSFCMPTLDWKVCPVHEHHRWWHNTPTSWFSVFVLVRLAPHIWQTAEVRLRSPPWCRRPILASTLLVGKSLKPFPKYCIKMSNTFSGMWKNFSANLMPLWGTDPYALAMSSHTTWSSFFSRFVVINEFLIIWACFRQPGNPGMPAFWTDVLIYLFWRRNDSIRQAINPNKILPSTFRRIMDNSYPRQLVPKTTRTQGISYPRQLVPKTTRTQDNSYPIRLVPKTTRTQDNSYSHRATRTQDNSYPDPGQFVLKETRTHDKPYLG